jgi:integrase
MESKAAKSTGVGSSRWPGWTPSLPGETHQVDTLKRHRDAQRVERALAGDAYHDDDLVFCDELGRPIPPDRISERFLTHRTAAGLAVGSMHILRHTAATLMLAGDPKQDVPPMPIHVVAARLGDRPETILKAYAHLLPQSDEQAAQQLATLLAGSR